MKFACIFPGQGSQSIGMMAKYDGFPVVRETFAEASDVLGEDFWAMVSDGPAERIDSTINTQPLMLAAGVAVYRAFRSLIHMKPAFMAGHSLGEYTALVASGALPFAEALPLVRYRGEVMQQAVPEGAGAMAAILGLEDEGIRQLCDEITNPAEGILEPANFNSPGQIVIAGHRHMVERGMEAALSRGAKRAVMLPVSIPSHCSLMRPAAEKMAQRLAAIALRPPEIPLLHNADVQQHDHPDSIRRVLLWQLSGAVRWTDTIRSFAEAGVTHVVECGPGKVLSSLGKRIDARLQSLALADDTALRHAESILRGA